MSAGSATETLLGAYERWKLLVPRAPRTISDYGYALRRMDRWGMREISEISPVRLSDYIAWRKGPEGGNATETTIRQEVAALSSVLGHMERLDIFPLESLRKLRRSRPKIRRPAQFSAPFLTIEEYERLEESAATVSPRAELLVGMAAWSGLRACELARVNWDEIHVGAKPWLDVRWVEWLGQDGRIKTYRERKVPICRELMAILERQPKRKGYLFGPEIAQRLGPHKGRPLEKPFARVRVLRRDLAKARKLAGMPEVDFHLLRHTRASWWIQGDVSPARVAYFLGNTLDVVLRYYSGITPGYDSECEKGPKRTKARILEVPQDFEDRPPRIYLGT